MDKFKVYDIGFSGLKSGKHFFSYEIDSAFFDLFGIEQDFRQVEILARVLLNKHSTFLEFTASIEGKVVLNCDISNEGFDCPVANEIKFLVQFGDQYDDSNEEIIVIPRNSYRFNIAKIIYETIVLSIPMKRISPNLKKDYLESLERFSPGLNILCDD